MLHCTPQGSQPLFDIVPNHLSFRGLLGWIVLFRFGIKLCPFKLAPTQRSLLDLAYLSLAVWLETSVGPSSHLPDRGSVI